MSHQQDSSTHLIIKEDEGSGLSVSEADTTFIIKKHLHNTSQREYDQVYRDISNANIELDLGLPVYHVAWKHIILHRRGRLQEMVHLYKRLEKTIEEVEPDTLVCSNDLDRAYRAVLIDIGDEYDIKTDCQIRSERLSRIQRCFVSSVLLLPFFIDQLFGLVLKQFVSQPNETPTVFVPGLGRLDSMTPVFDEMDTDFKVVIASMAGSWFWRLRHDGLDEFDPVPVSQYTTVSCLFDQLSMHIRLCKSVFFDNTLKRKLGSTLSTELNVNMDRSLVYALQEGFRTRMFGSLYLYYLFGNVFEETQCENVVIGSLSPAGKAISVRSITDGVNVYHIPHGIGAGGDCPNPLPELTQFVSGELEKQFYTESPQVEKPWNCIVTGRAYLTELYESYATTDSDSRSTEPYHIVLATQPLYIRREFVEEAIAAIEDAEFDAKIIIKIHPSESPETYASYAENNDQVTIAGSNLHQILDEADLTLTVRSNVGVESIIIGTPCVCLNWWYPIIGIPMYARYDGMPVLDGPTEVECFFKQLTTEKLDELLEDETKLIHKYYELTIDAAQQMAAEIETYDDKH